MADLTKRGRPMDERTKKIRLRRLEYEIAQLENAIIKYEIDAMEAQAQIERLQESNDATRAAIEKKRDELAAAMKEETDDG